jgi:hypothetical protein
MEWKRFVSHSRTIREPGLSCYYRKQIQTNESRNALPKTDKNTENRYKILKTDSYIRKAVQHHTFIVVIDRTVPLITQPACHGVYGLNVAMYKNRPMAYFLARKEAVARGLRIESLG